jgi:hypothetical protein
MAHDPSAPTPTNPWPLLPPLAWSGDEASEAAVRHAVAQARRLRRLDDEQRG